MRRTVAAFIVSLVLLSVAISTRGQQKAPEEFVSVIGQFGVMLPTTIRDDFKYDILRMEDDKLVAWEYRWNLDSDQAAIIYAIANVDMEAKADLYLERLRDNYAPGTIRNQKKTSFAGHPGLVAVIDSANPIRKSSRADLDLRPQESRLSNVSDAGRQRQNGRAPQTNVNIQTPEPYRY